MIDIVGKDILFSKDVQRIWEWDCLHPLVVFRKHTLIAAIDNFSLIPAATIGPMISSALLESAGGSYNTNFYAIVGFAVAALVMWFLLNRASKAVE